MHRNIVGTAGLVCLAAAHPSSGQTAMEPHERFLCTFGSSQRQVSIFIRPLGARPDSAACRVDYTKDGKTQTLWASQSDRAYCTAKAISLVTKLAEGNYACKPEAVVRQEEPEPSE